MSRFGAYASISLLALLASFGLTATVQAAPAVTAGIGLSPAVQDRVLGPKDTSTSFSVQLSNQTNQPLAFTLSSRDFTSLNQAGGLTFLASDTTRVTKGHGLSSVLSFDTANVTIAANSSKTITASIQNVTQLAPGGHYAAIVAQAVPEQTSTTGNHIAINQALSSLIFLETAGKGSKGISLSKPPLNKVLFSLPDTVNLVFNATGNTQTVPRGLVTIERGDKTYRQGIINENSSLLLPGSTRLLPTAVQGNQHPFWMGRYTLRVQYRYEGSLGINEYQKTFYYVNVPALIAIISALVIIVLVIIRTKKYWKNSTTWLKNFMKSPDGSVISPSDNNHITGKVMDIRRPKK